MPPRLPVTAYESIVDRFLADAVDTFDVDGVPHWFARAAVDGIRARLVYELRAVRQLGRDVAMNGEAMFVAGRQSRPAFRRAG